MLHALVLAALAPFPSGAYGMPELCQKLGKATGVIHRVTSPLEDYPVFVSVKNGDPMRVEKLVALALHAKWIEEKGIRRLSPIKPEPDEGFAEWKDWAKKAFASCPGVTDLPLIDIYTAPCGTAFRFSESPKPDCLPLPKAALDKMVPGKDGTRVLFFRKYSSRLFTGCTGFATCRDLPPPISAELDPKLPLKLVNRDLGQLYHSGRLNVFTFQAKEEIRRRDWSAILSGPLFSATASVLERDFALPLFDVGSFMPKQIVMMSYGTLRDVMTSYSPILDWELVDGAIVGRLPLCERLHCTQSRRSADSWLLSEQPPGTVLSVAPQAAFLARERPDASQAGSSTCFMRFAGFHADRRFDVKVGSLLTPSDWGLVRQERVFSVASLSGPVQLVIREMLVDVSDQTGADRPGVPLLWPSIQPKDLEIEASEAEDRVVVVPNESNAMMSEVEPVMTLEEAVHHDHVMQSATGDKIKYRPGVRRQVVMTIRPIEAESGWSIAFSDYTFDPAARAVPRQQLPEPFRSEFEKMLKEIFP